MIDFLNEYWWLSIILIVALFLGDHYMTVLAAKIHKTYLAQYITYQAGLEMNPNFEKEVANFQWFTRKHFTIILGFIISLSIIRLLGVIEIFEFFIGAYLLLWLYVDLRHIINILYLQDIRKPNSLIGKIETSYWLSQRQVEFMYMSQAILFGVVALASMRPFFWGGALGLLFQGFRHLSLANRYPAKTSQAVIQKTNE